MKTKYCMIALAAMTMILGSCSDSNSEFSQDYLADTPIKLNVSVDEPRTRAGYSNAELPEGFMLNVDHYLDLANKIPDEKYSYPVWAEKVEDGWKTYDLTQYLTDRTKKEVTMLWANMNDKVEVTAYTKFGEITIPTDQTSDEQLKQADVLYMKPTMIDPSKEGIKVDLQHAMSKINLTIELGSEYEFSKEDVDLKIKDVKIDGSLVSATVYANGIYDEYGVPTPIFPFHTGTTPYSKTGGVITKASATYEAILIPQYMASGEFTVSFKVDGKLYEWAYNQELTLAPNTAYTLKLTAGDDKVQPVSFSVAPWGVGNGDNGEEKETD